MSVRCLLASVLCVALLIVGCGPPSRGYVYVTGAVTLDGQPLDDALVMFSSDDQNVGEDASGRTDASGKYTLQTSIGEPDTGTKPGSYTVLVIKKKVEWDGKSMIEAPGTIPVKAVRSTDLIPATYMSPATSPFKAAVTKDKSKNVFNFELKSKP